MEKYFNQFLHTFSKFTYFCCMKNNITIRRASVDDCELINEMAWKVFPATYEKILTKEQNDFMMDWMYSIPNLRKQMNEGHLYFILYLENGSVPAGYVSIQKQGEDLFHLQKIYVLPEFQGRNLGKALFEHAVAEIKRDHPEPCTVELNVNRNNKAVAFYEKMGMHKARQGDFPIGKGFYMNDYIMAMDI